MDRLLAVKAGAERFLLWGWAEYDDVFAWSGRHRTEFANEVI